MGWVRARAIPSVKSDSAETVHRSLPSTGLPLCLHLCSPWPSSLLVHATQPREVNRGLKIGRPRFRPNLHHEPASAQPRDTARGPQGAKDGLCAQPRSRMCPTVH